MKDLRPPHLKRQNVILPHRHQIPLRHPNAPISLHICHRRIPHDLPVHVAHGAPLLHEHAIAEHRRGARAPARKVRDVAHGEHGDQAEEFGRTAEDLHDARAAEAVEHHVLEVVDARAELLVELFEAAAIGVALLDEVFPRVDELAAFGVLDEALLGEFPQEDLGDGGAEYDAFRVLLLGYLGDVLVCVWVVDLVEGDDGGELLVCKGVDYTLDGLVRPVLKRLLEA